MSASAFVSNWTCGYASCRTLLRMFLYLLVSCSIVSMQLVGPNGPNIVEGRVEYCNNGVRGTVVDANFDSLDGEVVCQSLGYQRPSETLKTLKQLSHRACVILGWIPVYYLQEFRFFKPHTMVKEEVQLFSLIQPVMAVSPNGKNAIQGKVGIHYISIPPLRHWIAL